MSEIPTLRIAVILFPGVANADYQGPMEILGAAEVKSAWPFFSSLPGIAQPKSLFDVEYVAETLDPIRPITGPLALPTKTFNEAMSERFDVILVPGGPSAHPDVASKATLEFIKVQSSQARYCLSVCTGSWLLALVGALEGKRATTNKAFFNDVKEKSSSAIKWAPDARWVVDGNIWTSSGVTGGQGMAYEFLKTVSGEDFAKTVKDVLQLEPADSGDVEFADASGPAWGNGTREPLH